MAWRRPSSWEIAAAYIEEGYRAYLEGSDPAFAVEVERTLGLPTLDAVDWCQQLVSQGLITMEPFTNALGAYRLAPRGLAVAERLPDLMRVVEDFTAAVHRSNAPADEKRRATFSVKEEIYKVAISKTAQAAIDNKAAIWETLRALYNSLPLDWRPSS